MDIDSISVIDGWFPTVVIVLTIVTLLASLGWRPTERDGAGAACLRANGPRRRCAGDRPGGGSYF